ncbi:MAG: metallophosphoesterase [Chitinophagaceae bacterium]|nr:metallophosphoesterase [Chitinophagaceae bacterium]
MRKLLRFLLLKPVLWAAAKFSSKPKREKVFAALSALYKNILEKPGHRGPVIPFDPQQDRFIIFSDQHKGRRNGADDFTQAEPNYLAALDHYYKAGYTFINLGDSEELWENNLWQVKKKNKATFEAERKFLEAGRHLKVFGNHDLFWDNDPFAGWQLRSIFKEKVKIYEGVVLKAVAGSPLTVFLTHGHQGDAQSDGNWFSKFFVAKIWAPLQSLLRINPNTPAYDAEKKTLHNSMMYEWSSEQENLLLVTGHTHQPVFGSLTHLERLYRRFQFAEKDKNAAELKNLLDEIRKREKEFSAVAVDYMNMKPTYYNTGCCCFSDGDITGIEISGGYIRLVKWTMIDGKPEPQELEKAILGAI